MKLRFETFTPWLVAVATSACGGSEGSSAQDSSELLPTGAASKAATPIVDLSTFVELKAVDDPFTDRPLNAAPCVSWGLEETYLEVNTGGCPYVTLSGPILRALPAGTTLSTTFWHTPLTAAEAGAEAHVEVSLGDLALLSERIPIPAPDQAYASEVRLSQSVPEQAQLFIHVHNHGANAYRFTPISARY